MADHGDEVGHPAPQPLSICLVDRSTDCQRSLAVGKQRRERGLMCDESAHVLGVPSHECKSIDRAAAAGEQIDRPASELLDYLVHVIGVLLRCRRGRRLGQLAARFHAGRR